MTCKSDFRECRLSLLFKENSRATWIGKSVVRLMLLAVDVAVLQAPVGHESVTAISCQEHSRATRIGKSAARLMLSAVDVTVWLLQLD